MYQLFLVLSDLKLTACKTLQLWLTVAKGCSSVDLSMDALFPILIFDISPQKSELNLTVRHLFSFLFTLVYKYCFKVQSGGVKNMNKKARKKMLEQKTTNFANRLQTSSIGYVITSQHKHFCCLINIFQEIFNEYFKFPHWYLWVFPSDFSDDIKLRGICH